MIDMGAPNFIALFLLRIPNMVSLKILHAELLNSNVL